MKKCCTLTIRFNSRHGLNPFSKIIHGHNNMVVLPSQGWVVVHEIHPPLSEGIDGDEWVNRGWVRAHFPSEHLVRVTLPNRFNVIFKIDRKNNPLAIYFGLLQDGINDHHTPHCDSH